MKQAPRSPQPVAGSREPGKENGGTRNSGKKRRDGEPQRGRPVAPTGQAGSPNGAGREKKTAEAQRGRPGGYLSPVAAAFGGARSKGLPLADTLTVPLARNSFSTACAHLP